LKTVQPVLPFALAYHRRKWALVKIGYKQKSPLESSWNTRRWTDPEVHKEFSGQCNVGIILGECSDWLVDVDLDCPEAIDLAPALLPPTLTFGREGARRSHWLYKSVGAATEKYTMPDPEGGHETIVELRAQNAAGASHQTVLPGSVYKDGSPIEFDDGKGPGSDVQTIAASALANAVRQLATAIAHVRLGATRDEAIATAKNGDFRVLDKKAPTARLNKKVKLDDPLAAAIVKYNADHPQVYPVAGSGMCPICGHGKTSGSWGQSTRGPGYWSCFSASHQEGGAKAGDVWTGDALDIAAHKAGLTPRAYLLQEKYLGEEKEGPKLQRDDKGVPVPSLHNVAALLEHERSDLHFDAFLSQVRCNGRQWTDADTLALAERLQTTPGMLRVPLHIVAQGAEAYARRHGRNCVVEFLEGLEWDGRPRIEQCFVLAFGATDSEYTRAVSRNFWRALVARPLQPGCQSDAMVVLEGEQGIRKSSACRVIAGDWFADTDQMPGNKDFCIMLQGKLLVELGEMHAFSRAEVTAVKTAVSRRVDTYRAPFGRVAEDHRRQGSLIGTTNQFEWAQDPTGGRRFWPIRCGTVDLEWLVANREQLFAEAVRDIRAGLSWHEVPQADAKAEQDARYATDLWEDAVLGWLTRAAKKETTSLEIAQEIYTMKLGSPSPGDNRRIGAIMRRLGWVSKKRQGAGRYWVPG
jgi:hypothetical protein